MTTKSTKTIANRIAALFFSCALAVSLLPAAAFTAFADNAGASAVEAEAPDEQQELDAEQAADAEDAQSADIAAQAPEEAAPQSDAVVTPAANESLIGGINDQGGYVPKEDSAATGMWSYERTTRTLTIQPKNLHNNTSCVLYGKPWATRGLDESEVLYIRLVGNISLKQSTIKTFSGFKNVGRISMVDTNEAKSYVDASQMTDMSGMFEGLSELYALHLNGLNSTGNVKNMSNMFSGCIKLASIEGLERLNTNKVTDMSGMFSNCKKISSINISKFNTANVTTMNGMFRNCDELDYLSFPSTFNTANVGNMSEMFQGCSSLKSLNLSSFNTAKATSMINMFRNCVKLEAITFNNTFKGTNVTDVNNMFAGCTNLTSVDLSNFDTPNVRFLNCMFLGCSNLSTINISAVDTSKAATWDMFNGCNKLEYLKVGKNFTFKGGVTPTNPDYKLGLPSGEWVSSASSLSPQSAASLLENPLNGPNGTTYFKTPINLENVTIAKPANATYTGKAITPKPAVTLGENGNALTEGVAFKYVYLSNIGAGKAYVGIEAISSNGSFKGSSRMIEFTIAPKSITGATVTIDAQPYTGEPREPDPKVVVDGTTLVKGTDYTVTYANNTKAGTATATITAKGNYTGTVSKTFTISTSVPVPESEKQVMHRLYNPNSGEHFYTKDTNERDSLVKVGWRYEGTAWTAPVKSSTPVYRLYNPNAGDHHYTTSAGEKDYLVKVGWNYEGIGWYSETLQSVPVYRLYNPNAVTGTHHYTTNKAENDNLVRVGWRAEGVGWYGMK